MSTKGDPDTGFAGSFPSSIGSLKAKYFTCSNGISFIESKIDKYSAKNGGMTVVKDAKNEMIATPLVTGWRVCFDYHALNAATRKYHFSLPFIDQMLDMLAGYKPYFSSIHLRGK